MGKLGLDADEARRRLEAAGGVVARVIGDLAGGDE